MENLPIQLLAALLVFVATLWTSEYLPDLLTRRWGRALLAAVTLLVIVAAIVSVAHFKLLVVGTVLAYMAQALMIRSFQNPPSRDFIDFFDRDSLQHLRNTQLPRDTLSLMAKRLARVARTQGSEGATRSEMRVTVTEVGNELLFDVEESTTFQVARPTDATISLEVRANARVLARPEGASVVSPRSDPELDKWKIRFWPAIDTDTWSLHNQDITAEVRIRKSKSPQEERVVGLRTSRSKSSVTFSGPIHLDAEWDTVLYELKALRHRGKFLHFYAWATITESWLVTANRGDLGNAGPHLGTPVTRRPMLTPVTTGVLPLHLTSSGSTSTVRIDAGGLVILPEDAVILTMDDVTSSS